MGMGAVMTSGAQMKKKVSLPQIIKIGTAAVEVVHRCREHIQSMGKIDTPEERVEAVRYIHGQMWGLAEVIMDVLVPPRG
jgi:hypothetical protein